MKIKIYNQKGDVAKETNLPKEVFGLEVKESLVHKALIRQLSNSRSPIAHTLEKGEVRGGGRKPYRQKGTGRARQGSIRNPHYVGGGVAFGPRNNRNFQKQMPKKERRKALLMALSAKATDKQVFGLDKYQDKELKTKNFAELLGKLPVDRDVLIVVSENNDDYTNLKRVTGNLPNVKTILANYLNIQDLQKYESLCLVGDSVQTIQETFTI
jgi:large subunit ribosomal protein L4